MLALPVLLSHDRGLATFSLDGAIMIHHITTLQMMRGAFLSLLLAIFLSLPVHSYAQEKKDPELQAVIAAIRVKAEGGDAESQYRMGLYYLEGQGVEKNFDTAFAWFSKASDQNFAPAQYDLGVMHALGEGVKKDYAAAEKLYRKAAEKNYPDALFGLGLMYERGEGVKKDMEEAAKYYRQAAGIWRGAYMKVLSEKN